MDANERESYAAASKVRVFFSSDVWMKNLFSCPTHSREFAFIRGSSSQKTSSPTYSREFASIRG
jgi:predicted kinase